MSEEEEKRFNEVEYGHIFSKEKGLGLEDLFEARQKDAAEDYNLLREHISSNDSCLEVGSATGYFLHYIKKKVGSVTGLEIHEGMRKFANAKGIETKRSFSELDGRLFDKVIMLFLLEHIGDPIGFLKTAQGHLREGGKLFVKVPNVKDALLSLYDIPAFREFYFTPAHPYYFSRETLSEVLRRAGFVNFEIIEFQRYELSNHVNWMVTGKPGGTAKYDKVFSQELLAEYKRCIERKGMGDALLAIATK